jgi:hypothetical protein
LNFGVNYIPNSFISKITKIADIMPITLEDGVVDDYARLFQVHRNQRTGCINALHNLSEIDIGLSCRRWACDAVKGLHDEDECWMSMGIESKTRSTASEFCSLFSLNLNTFRSWAKRKEKCRLSHDDAAGGRPKKISKAAMIEIKNAVMNGGSSEAGRPINLSTLLVEGAKMTARENGKSEIEVTRLDVDGFSGTSLRRYAKEHKFVQRKAQKNDATRQAALKDLRLMFHWVILFSALNAHLPAYKKFNSDQSMIGVETEGTGMRVWICKEEEANSLEEGERLVVTTDSVRL